MNHSYPWFALFRILKSDSLPNTAQYIREHQSVKQLGNPPTGVFLVNVKFLPARYELTRCHPLASPARVLLLSEWVMEGGRRKKEHLILMIGLNSCYGMQQHLSLSRYSYTVSKLFELCGLSTNSFCIYPRLSSFQDAYPPHRPVIVRIQTQNLYHWQQISYSRSSL